VNNELERIWKDLTEVLSQHFPGGKKENHKYPQPGQLVFQAGHELKLEEI
jgi:hypothetical protein